jgi:hypothetical protein
MGEKIGWQLLKKINWKNGLTAIIIAQRYPSSKTSTESHLFPAIIIS